MPIAGRTEAPAAALRPLGLKLEELEAEFAKQRQGTRTDLGEHSVNFTESPKGETRDIGGERSPIGESVRIFDMRMACHTQEEIGEAVGVPPGTVGREVLQFGNLADLKKPDQAAATHATDFDAPGRLYQAVQFGRSTCSLFVH